MTFEQFKSYQEQSFDAFCKAVIRNEATDIHRKRRRTAEKECSFSSLTHAELSAFYHEDTYQTYLTTYYVRGYPICVHDLFLGEALQFLHPQHRDVILLSYFLDYSDTEISRFLNISCPTVRNRKTAALKNLKLLMERKNNG